MPRHRNVRPSKRFNLTLDAEAAEQLERHAQDVRRPPATVAAQLLMGALRRMGAPEVDEAADLREQVTKLTGERDRLRRMVHEQRDREAQAAFDSPRYEWPPESLLADTGWWQRWLPRLSELLGRRNPDDALLFRSYPCLDSQGYADLMGVLLPPIPDGAGRAEAAVSDQRTGWWSVDYGARARAMHELSGHVAWLDLAQTWAPVLRHVAQALCLLERTAEPGSDPYLRLRAEDELSGPWLRVLGAIIGAQAPAGPLPFKSIPDYRGRGLPDELAPKAS